MKKLFSVLSVLVLFSAFFVSCKQSYKTDEDGLIYDFNDGVDCALKNEQNILLFITMEGDDLYSKTFMDNVVRSPDFSNIKDNYTVVHFDFSQTSYEKTVSKTDADKTESKAAEEYAEVMQYNTQVATLLDVSFTPSLYILTEDGYYIADTMLSEQIASVNDFSKLINSFSSKIDHFNKLFAATEEGTSLDKVAAIDAVFEATDVNHRDLLAELAREVPELDKVNRSGLVGKYLYAAAEADAIGYYRAGQIADSVKAYTDVTKEKFITPEYKQQALYMAAYIMISSGTTDFATILDYLKKSVEANPNGENVANIQNIYDYIQTIQTEYAAELEKQQNPAAATEDSDNQLMIEEPDNDLEIETE